MSTEHTRRQAVLEELERARDSSKGGWVSTRRICSDEVGGPNGTRRLRELREAGVEIEMRTEQGTAWYRLAGPHALPEPPRGCSVCASKTVKGTVRDNISGKEIDLCASHLWRFSSLAGFEEVR